MSKNALPLTTTEQSEGLSVSKPIRNRIDRLMQKENGVDTLKKAKRIITALLRDNHDNREVDTPRNIIDCVIRMHLLSLACERGLNVAIFENQRLSAQEICTALLASAPGFSKTPGKLKKIGDFLKPQNVQTFINRIATDAQDTDEPPLTNRRTPVDRIRPNQALSRA